MADPKFVPAVSKTTGAEQLIPSEWLTLAAAGVEPFNDFEAASSEVQKPVTGTTKKEARDA